MNWTLEGKVYKRFVPRRGAVLVPMSDRASALEALGLFTPVKWQARFAGWAARGVVRLLGPRVLPGRAFEWHCPIPPEIWEQLTTEWTGYWGPTDTIAVYERTFVSWPGLGLLFMRRGAPIAFVKVRQTDTELLQNEARAIELVWSHQPSSFKAVKPLAYGQVGSWHYLAMSPLPRGSHTVPGNTFLDPVIEDIHIALQDFPREPGLASHWEPMHGDLTPWNLRRVAGDQLVLIDWECAGWGPPDADRVLFAMTTAVATGRRAERIDATEAVEFWRARISSHPNLSGRAGEYKRAMLRALEQSH